jgi:hypothetical protein
MSTDAAIERLVEALQQDGPSDRDAARLRARLAGIGIATGAGLAEGTAAASVPVAKAAASAGVGLSTRWASLALLPKMGIVAVVAATAVGGPLVAVEIRGRAVAEPAKVAAPVHDGARSAADPAPERAVSSNGVEAKLAARTALAEPGAVTPVKAPGMLRAEDARHAAVRAPRAGAGTPGEKKENAGGERTPAADVAAAPVLASTTTTNVVASSAGATARFVENPSSSPPPRASSLAEETALMDAAFAAVRVGDAATAEALVAEHARRFPQGLLWRERERARQQLATVRGAPGG